MYCTRFVRRDPSGSYASPHVILQTAASTARLSLKRRVKIRLGYNESVRLSYILSVCAKTRPATVNSLGGRCEASASFSDHTTAQPPVTSPSATVRTREAGGVTRLPNVTYTTASLLSRKVCPTIAAPPVATGQRERWVGETRPPSNSCAG